MNLMDLAISSFPGLKIHRDVGKYGSEIDFIAIHYANKWSAYFDKEYREKESSE